jgi:hypothetical protein
MRAVDRVVRSALAILAAGMLCAGCASKRAAGTLLDPVTHEEPRGWVRDDG